MFKGAPTIVEEACGSIDAQQPYFARPNMENLARNVNRRRFHERPSEPQECGHMAHRTFGAETFGAEDIWRRDIWCRGHMAQIIFSKN